MLSKRAYVCMKDWCRVQSLAYQRRGSGLSLFLACREAQSLVSPGKGSQVSGDRKDLSLRDLGDLLPVTADNADSDEPVHSSDLVEDSFICSGSQLAGQGTSFCLPAQRAVARQKQIALDQMNQWPDTVKGR